MPLLNRLRHPTTQLVFTFMSGIHLVIFFDTSLFQISLTCSYSGYLLSTNNRLGQPGRANLIYYLLQANTDERKRYVYFLRNLVHQLIGENQDFNTT